MLQSLQTSLIIVDSTYPAPKVYWEWSALPSLKRIDGFQHPEAQV